MKAGMDSRSTASSPSARRAVVRQWALRLAPLVVLTLIVILFFALGFNRYLSMEMLREHGLGLQAMAQQRFWLALVVFVLVYALATASTVPGPVFLTLLGGLMFGPWIGALAQATGATIGAVVIYHVYRTALGRWLRARFKAQAGLMDRITQGIDQNAFVYLLTLRLIPSVPFVLVNMAAGMVAAPLRPYVAATFLGLLPSTLIYTWIGAGLGDLLEAGEQPDIGDLASAFFWPLMGVAFLSLLLPVIVHLVRSRRGRAKPDPR
jgi:uncharacterized membrane protein YdjX (TVP38/TMEM64 family)